LERAEIVLGDVRVVLITEGSCDLEHVAPLLLWCLSKALPGSAAGLARNMLLDLYALASGMGADYISGRAGVPVPRECTASASEGHGMVRCPSCAAWCLRT